MLTILFVITVTGMLVAVAAAVTSVVLVFCKKNSVLCFGKTFLIMSSLFGSSIFPVCFYFSLVQFCAHKFILFMK